MRDGKASVFIAMGGNFVAATPDTEVTEAALRRLRADRARLDQAQPLAPGHRANGADPAVARAHREGRRRRPEAVVTVEDSMSVVHLSRGGLTAGQRAPAQRGGDRVRTRAGAVRTASIAVPWAAVRRRLRPHPRIASREWSPGSRTSTRACASRDGFVLPHPPRDERRFATRQRQGQLRRQRAALAAGARRAG